MHGYGTGTVWRTYGSTGECGMTKGRLAECVSGVAAVCTHQADVGVRCFVDAGEGEQGNGGREAAGGDETGVGASGTVILQRPSANSSFGAVVEWSNQSCHNVQPYLTGMAPMETPYRCCCVTPWSARSAQPHPQPRDRHLQGRSPARRGTPPGRKSNSQPGGRLPLGQPPAVRTTDHVRQRRLCWPCLRAAVRRWSACRAAAVRNVRGARPHA